MAYSDQGMSTGKVWSIIIVIAVHVLLGYALITGLAGNFVQKIQDELEVVDVEEPPPPPEEEPPPPPPEDAPIEPPPVVSPPPLVNVPTPPPPILTQPTPPKVFNPIPVTPPPAPPQPPAPPVTTVSKQASARGNPGSWLSDADYPARARREEREGRVGVRFDVSPAGRIVNCSVTSSSGSPDLDAATCTSIQRRGRYTPAVDQAGNPTTQSGIRLAFSWRLTD